MPTPPAAMAAPLRAQHASPVRGITLVKGLQRSSRLDRLAEIYAQYVQSAATSGRPPRGLWLAPHARAAELVPRLLQAQGLSACLAPRATTIRRLAESVVSSHLSTPLLLPRSASRWLLRQALAAVHATGGLKLLASALDRPGLVDALEETIEEWKACGIDAPQALEWLEQHGGDRRQQELALVYHHYQRLLDERGAADRFDVRRIAASQWRDPAGPSPHYDLLIVDSLDSVPPSDYALLREVLTTSDRVYVGMLAEVAGDEPSPRTDLFTESTRQVAWLESLGRPLMEEIGSAAQERGRDFVTLRERLFLPPAVESPTSPSEPANVFVSAAADTPAELAKAARQIKQWIVADGVPPSEIVLAVPSLSHARSQVAETLQSYNVPFWIDHTPTVGETPAVVALLALLNLHHDDWPYRQLLEVATCRLLAALDVPTPDSRWPSERAATEWLIRELQVARGRAPLVEQIARLAEIETDTPISPRRQAAPIAQHSIGLLASALDQLPEVATPRQWIDAVTQLAESLGLTLESNPPSSWSRLREGAIWIERAAGNDVPQWSLDHCLDYLRDAGRWMFAPPSHSREARVAVLGLSAARYTRPRHMIVVGLGEKGLVLSGDRRGLLSDEELQRMASSDGTAVPNPSSDYTRAMRLFFDLVTASRESLTLSYPALDNRGQQMPPSPLLMEACQALGQPWIDELLRPPLVGQLPDAGSTPHSVKEWRLRSVADLTQPAPQYQPLASLLSNGATRPVAHQLARSLRAIHARASGDGFGPWEGMLATPHLERLLSNKYGPRHIWSASQLETYAECPFKFYLRHVLGIEKQDDLVLATDHARQGSLAHDALKTLHELLRDQLPPGHPVGAADPSLFDDLYEQGVQQALRSYASSGAEGVLTELMAIQVRKWRDLYREQHQQYDQNCQTWDAPLVPTHLELRFGPASRQSDAAEDPNSTSTPFALEVEGGAILFAGRIDRIDVGRVAGQIVFQIIDYKTARYLTLPDDHLRDGRKLQPTLYALAASSLVGSETEPALPMGSGYWGVRAKGLTHLEMHRIEEGQLVETPTWKEIRELMVERVRQLVQGIRHGEFPVYPTDPKQCRYCEYRQCCRVHQAQSLGKMWQLGATSVDAPPDDPAAPPNDEAY